MQPPKATAGIIAHLRLPALRPRSFRQSHDGRGARGFSRRAEDSLACAQLLHRVLVGGVVVAFIGGDLPEQRGHLLVACCVRLVGEVDVHLGVS